MFLLLGFAFLAGLVTILAPCIWPLLPIILSSSIAGNADHKRPLGITLGIIISFTFFTLFISTLVSFLHLDPNVLRIVAVIIISFLGLTMIFPPLTKWFELLISKLSNKLTPNGQGSVGFTSGFITGLSLGIVWSPCAGPILASIATLAATNQVNLQVFLVTMAYVIGVGIPLFLFAYAGQRFISGSRKLSPFTGRIQQVFGVVMILTAFLIYSNKVSDFQVSLVNKFPALDTVFNGFENTSAVKDQLAQLKGNKPVQPTPQAAANDNSLFNANTPAPEFTGITKWLNLPAGQDSLTLKSLQGKVVLVDFWTYTCINCIRTLPYVTRWYDTYHNDGFVVVGVHTPEFAFEKDTNNVADAIKRFNIHYPVAQDNNYSTWNTFNNEYWPAEYLIDAKGIVKRYHFGEGEYDQMEKAIQALLAENGKKVTDSAPMPTDTTPQYKNSPETYLGSARMEFLAGSGKVENGQQTFTLPTNIPQNQFAFGGTWNIQDEYAQVQNNATLSYNFIAGHVYLVLKPGTAQNGIVTVMLDNKLITPEVAGKDVSNGRVTVDSDRLYELVALPKPSAHILQLTFQTPGIQTFAFTFGD